MFAKLDPFRDRRPLLHGHQFTNSESCPRNTIDHGSFCASPDALRRKTGYCDRIYSCGLSHGFATIVFTGPVGTNTSIQKMILRDLPATKGKKILSVEADEERAIVDEIVK